MTLHLIIFTSKGQHSEIKHSITQNHLLCFKCPLELASEKRYSIFPFISKTSVKLVKLLLDIQVSQGSKEGTDFEKRQLFANFISQVTVWPSEKVIVSFWGWICPFFTRGLYFYLEKLFWKKTMNEIKWDYIPSTSFSIQKTLTNGGCHYYHYYTHRHMEIIHQFKHFKRPVVLWWENYLHPGKTWTLSTEVSTL